MAKSFDSTLIFFCQPGVVFLDIHVCQIMKMIALGSQNSMGKVPDRFIFRRLVEKAYILAKKAYTYNAGFLLGAFQAGVFVHNGSMCGKVNRRREMKRQVGGLFFDRNCLRIRSSIWKKVRIDFSLAEL